MLRTACPWALPGLVALLVLLGAPLDTATLQAQTQGDNWFFGDSAGLSFATNPPTPIANGALSTREGCAAVSDVGGNLLFYTDGRTVWNRNNQVMVNGNGLLGNSSSTQCGVVVPVPCDSNSYYVFSVDDIGGPNGLTYSVVDMTQQGGLGEVTTKNQPLANNVVEKITSVLHDNGADYWILTHEWGSNNFLAFRATQTGIDAANPVISSVGSIHERFDLNGNELEGNTRGAMKLSPDGTKLAVAVEGIGATTEFVEIFDFDITTGQVSNPIRINLPAPYGVEFSPNMRYLYVSTRILPGPGDELNLYQIDLQAGSPAAIQASSRLVDTEQTGGLLQLGPDGIIYVGRFRRDWVGAILNPNVGFPNTVFDNRYVDLSPGTQSLYGLPTFPQNFFNINIGLSGRDSVASTDTNVQFQAFSEPGIIYTWQVQGPAVIRSDTGSRLFVDFTGPGVVTIIVNGDKITPCDTILNITQDTFQVVSVRVDQPVVQGQDSLCVGDQLQLTVTNPLPGDEFVWSGPNGFSLRTSNPTLTIPNMSKADSGRYTVYGDIGCCNSLQTVVDVHVFDFPGNTQARSNSPACSSDTLRLSADSVALATRYAWTGPNGFTATGRTVNIPNPTAADSGLYSVRAFNGVCSSAQSATIVDVDDPVTVSITLNLLTADTACQGDPMRLEAVSNGGGPGSRYQWRLNGQDVGAPTTTAIYETDTLDPGVYTVSVALLATDSCTTPFRPVSQDIQVRVKSNQPVGLDLDPTSLELCQGESDTVEANPLNGGFDPRFDWTLDGVQITFAERDSQFILPDTLAPGNHSLQATVSNFQTCTAQPSFTAAPLNFVVNPLPTLSGPTNGCAGDTLAYTYAAPAATLQVLGQSTLLAAPDRLASPAQTAAYTDTLTAITPAGCVDTLVVDFSPQPAVNGPDTVCGDNQAEFRPVPLVGGVQWSIRSAVGSTIDPATGVAQVGNAAATQTDTIVVDLNGCVGQSPLVILTLPAISGPNALCAGDTAQFTGLVPGQWGVISPRGNSIDPSGELPLADATVTYTDTVTLRTSQGCADTFEIQGQALPQLTIPDTTCGLLEQQLVTNSTGSWSIITPVGSTLDPQTGRYLPGNPTQANLADTVSFSTSAGCADTARIALREQPVLTGPDSLCAGSGGRYTSSMAGSFSLSSPVGNTLLGGDSIVFANNPTAYTDTLRFTAPNGCVQELQIYVEPTPIISGPTVLCGMAQDSFSAGSAPVTWRLETGSPSSLDPSTGQYRAANPISSFTDSVFASTVVGCADTAIVQVNPQPVLNGLPSQCGRDTGAYTVQLSGGDWTLNSGGGGSTFDTLQGLLRTANLTTPYTDTLVYTDTAGCADTLVVDVNPRPELTAPDSSCGGLSVQVTSTLPSASWSLLNTTGSSITPGGRVNLTNRATTFFDSVLQTTALGCADTASIQVNPQPVITGTAATCTGRPTRFNGFTTGNWSIETQNGSSVASDGTVTFGSGNSGFTDTLILTTNSGCADSLELPINPTPVLSGPTQLCGLQTQPYLTTVPGGTWTLRSTIGSTVDSNGLVNFGTDTTARVDTLVQTTDAGCADSLAITVNAQPQLNSPNQVCGLPLLQIQSDISGVWSVTSASTSPSIDQQGLLQFGGDTASYTLTVQLSTGAGCQDTQRIQYFPSVRIDGPVDVCALSVQAYSSPVPGQLTLGSSNGSVIGANGLVQFGNASSIFVDTIRLQSPGSCSGSLPIRVYPRPTIQAQDTTLCSGATLSLASSAPAAWSVRIGGSAIPSGNNTQQFAYTFQNLTGSPRADTVIARSYTCYDTLRVNVLPGLNLAVQEGPTYCPGETRTLTAQAVGDWYLRTPNGDSLLAANTDSLLWAPPQAGAYAQAGADTFLFQTAACTGSLVLVRQAAPELELGPDLTLCRGDSVGPQPQPGYSYLWRNGRTTARMAPDQSGLLFLEVLDNANGCVCRDTFTVTLRDVVADPFADPAFGSTLRPGNLDIRLRQTLSNDQQADWDLGDGTQQQGEEVNHTYGVSGDYAVTLVVTNTDLGCADTATGSYSVEIPEVSLPAVFSPNNDGINDRILVAGNDLQDYELTILNRWGQVIYTGTTGDPAWNGLTLEGDPAPEGVYYYRLRYRKSDGEWRSRSGDITLVR